MKIFLFYFAVTGWTIGLIVNLISIAEIDITVKIHFLWIWVLTIGTFIVWLPIVFELKNNEELIALKQSNTLTRINPFIYLKITFKNAPTWLTIISILGFFYATSSTNLNSLKSQKGIADIIDGKYSIQSHGQIIILTEQEYHQHKANEIRAISIANFTTASPKFKRTNFGE